MKYRPDIDGLRAIAVMLVVLFHAGLGFSGGYIGVDVFFVISGYLITSKLLDDYQSGTTSIAKFYSGRAKRILPALLVMYAVCLIVGRLLLLPIDFIELSRTTLSSALFGSNFYFYHLSGYFDGPAIEKPLLHTWSLAVEEQFYLVWPVICFYLLFKARAKNQAAAILVAGVASLLIAQYLLTTDRSAAFFFPVARAWELLAGALIAVRPVRLPAQTSPLSILYVAVIIASGLLLTSRSYVPGISAIPAIASVAFLTAAGPQTVAARVLAFEPIRKIGLISYSLYLWHWPLLAFTRYYLERNLTTWEAVVVVIASFGFASLSWAFVEQPIRHSRLTIRRALTTATAGLTATAVVAFLGFTNTRLGDVPAKAREAMADSSTISPFEKTCHHNKPSPINTSAECLIGAKASQVPDFVLIGDSHGDHFSPTLDLVGRKLGLTGIQITQGGGCMPIWGIEQVSGGRPVAGCDAYRSDVLNYIDSLPKDRLIVIAARWSLYLNTTAPNIDAPFYANTKDSPDLSVSSTRKNITDHLAATVKMLRERGHRVMIIDQIPEYSFFPLNCFVRHSEQANAGDLCGEDRSYIAPLMSAVEPAMNAAASAGATVLRPADYLCPSGRCTVAMNGTFLYRDIHHLNLKGSLEMAPFFVKALATSERAALQ